MHRLLGTLLSALAMSGCGLVLDLAPAPDAGTADAGMDAGTDAGSRDANVECERDLDCGPRDACGGHDVCRAGRCVPSPPSRRCDDGIACTVDECLADGSCRSTPQAGPCGGRPDFDCAGYRCDPNEGCRLVQVARCPDDGVACTEEVCDLSDGTCRTEFNHLLCPSGVCNTGGCEPRGCAEDVDCPRDDECSQDWECIEDRCVAGVLNDGDACTPNDFCLVDGFCDGGLCVSDTLRDCSDDSPCTLEYCDSAAEQCVRAPDPDLEGRECRAPNCETGTCEDGRCTDRFSRCESDPAMCERAFCDEGICNVESPCVAGNNACNEAGDCVGCLPGWFDCVGDGICESNTPCVTCEWPVSAIGTCPPGRVDCDGNGCCDCALGPNVCDPAVGLCVPRKCGPGGPALSCRANEQCCCGLCEPMGSSCPFTCPMAGI